MLFLIAVIANLLILTAGYHNTHFVDNRTAIVHLFEWKWEDIAKECENYLGPNGFGGVQLSPVNENAVMNNRPWYERYQPISYKLITRSGNREELQDMIRRCNAVGVRIYVDAVINHMAAYDPTKIKVFGTANSESNPGDRYFPAVPYTPDDFHPICSIQNYQDPVQVRNCELAGLRDLNHTKENVRNKIVEFFNELIDLGVAGFRIDAAKHMWPEDLEVIYKRVKNLNTNFGFPQNARPLIYQEVIDLGGENIKKYDYKHMGRVTEFKFSAEIGNLFRGNNKLKWTKNWGPEWDFLQTDDSIVFVDNHDNQRGHGAGGSSILTYKNDQLYKLASAFMLAHPYGWTRVMSSFHFSDPSQGPPQDKQGNIISPSFDSNGLCTIESGWVCEHRWKEIQQLVKFRNLVGNAPLTNWWDNGNNAIAFSREGKGFIVINNESNQISANLQTSLPAGKYCNLYEGGLVQNKCAGRVIEVDGSGKANIVLDSKKAIVLLYTDKI
ncbi:alpha-amylase 4N-like [Condylostylus longicornis]|uniref:alpha-amylase 4N-like n=1 Tax=Condylostylus longicornis TaxID=2530218 RepID=UPI00244E0E61|nr:alpha-amylase 4N-like [Condylostylus longicornis]